MGILPRRAEPIRERLSGSRSLTWDGGGFARLACWYIDMNAMARLAYLLLVVLLVLEDVPMVLATRRKPKRQPVASEDGGDRGAADPGPTASSSSAGVANPADASQHAGYRYCNDTVYATGDSFAAGTRSLPVGGLATRATARRCRARKLSWSLRGRLQIRGLLSKRIAPRWWRRRNGRRLCRGIRLLPNETGPRRRRRSQIASQVFCWFSKANHRRMLPIL